jgi:predicted GNAT family acetyltransferase
VSARDADDVLSVLASDPVAHCMVAARVEEYGIDTHSIIGQLWSHGPTTEGLCYFGANLMPLRGSTAALEAFSERARRRRRMCSSIVGRAELAMPLWEMLTPFWGRARDVRPDQPLMALAGPPKCLADPSVRRVRPAEIDLYMPAAIAMFREEVGVDPRLHDGGRAYRRRVQSLISDGLAFARFDGERVVFKAEVGSMSSRVGQIQGVWTDPGWRGRGYGASGTAAVAQAIHDSGRIASLYVNSFNAPARAAYDRAGFEQVGTFATILLD